eukprot:4065208-Pleurochrysis_carterae.AAC.1
MKGDSDEEWIFSKSGMFAFRLGGASGMRQECWLKGLFCSSSGFYTAERLCLKTLTSSSCTHGPQRRL